MEYRKYASPLDRPIYATIIKGFSILAICTWLTMVGIIVGSKPRVQAAQPATQPTTQSASISE